nr:hypothetical protein [Schaalia odontolytica]
MSNNPFADLASYLEAINSTNERYTPTLRSLAGDTEWFDFHSRVMQSLFEAKELARASDADDPALGLLDEIHQMLLLRTSNWDETRVTFESLKISMIRYIGKDVASRGLLPEPLTPEARGALQDALEKMQDYITGQASGLPENALGYLRYLVARCLDLLNGEDIDVVALRALSTQAAGTAFSLGTCIADEHKRNEFWSHCGTILKTWVAPMLTGAAGNLISSGFQHMMIGS